MVRPYKPRVVDPVTLEVARDTYNRINQIDAEATDVKAMGAFHLKRLRTERMAHTSWLKRHEYKLIALRKELDDKVVAAQNPAEAHKSRKTLDEMLNDAVGIPKT